MEHRTWDKLVGRNKLGKVREGCARTLRRCAASPRKANTQTKSPEHARSRNHEQEEEGK